MTNIKALEILEAHIRRARTSYDSPINTIHFIDVACKACEAIRKRIPQPVKSNNKREYNKECYDCPTCGRRLRHAKKDPYCPKCGQAVSW